MSPEQELAVDAFVSGAATVPETNPPAETAGRAAAASGEIARPRRGTTRSLRTERPWEAPHVRDDVVKGYALRLPEPLYLQLKWVADVTGRSINTVCREAIEREVGSHLPD